MRESRGIVDDDVEAAEFLGGVRNPFLQGRAVGDIDDSAIDFGAGLFQSGDGFGYLIGIAGADGDVGAFRDKCFGDGATDAACAAGDDGLFAFESEVHLIFSLWWFF